MSCERNNDCPSALGALQLERSAGYPWPSNKGERVCLSRRRTKDQEGAQGGAADMIVDWGHNRVVLGRTAREELGLGAGVSAMA